MPTDRHHTIYSIHKYTSGPDCEVAKKFFVFFNKNYRFA